RDERPMKLLILGGSRYNVPSILSARRAGFCTLVADRNPSAPGLQAADRGLPIDVADGAALLAAIADAGGVDGIMSMGDVGLRTAAALSARLDLPSISESAAANAVSKGAMRRLWQPLGRYSTDFRVVASPD